MQIETPPSQKPYDKPEGERRGLVIVNTGDGDGKGKSTAAFGLALRAHGRGKAVKIYQFMKVPTARFGEHRMFEQIGIPIEGLGDGFSWKSQNLEHSAQPARDGWQEARAAILGGEYFMVVLDELTYPLIYGWMPLDDVLQTLRERPPHVHVVITGRRCPPEIVALADTVTEMAKIKHAFNAGVPAQRGIEAEAMAEDRPGPSGQAFEAAAVLAVYRRIFEWRDMRHFAGGDVPPDRLRRLLGAAHHAPSVGFMQAWRSIRVTDTALRRRLHDVVEQERLATARALGEREDQFMRLKVQSLLEAAGVRSAICSTVKKSRMGHDRRHRRDGLVPLPTVYRKHRR